MVVILNIILLIFGLQVQIQIQVKPHLLPWASSVCVLLFWWPSTTLPWTLISTFPHVLTAWHCPFPHEHGHHVVVQTRHGPWGQRDLGVRILLLLFLTVRCWANSLVPLSLKWAFSYNNDLIRLLWGTNKTVGVHAPYSAKIVSIWQLLAIMLWSLPVRRKAISGLASTLPAEWPAQGKPEQYLLTVFVP